MRVKELLEEGARRITGISDIPKKEARLLLASYLKKDQLWLLTHESEEICEKGYLELIERRSKNEPVEYITHSANFYSRDFYVDKRVLIPRPETEILIDEVVSTCKGLKTPIIVEIGTGSGIISIMLAILLPNAIIKAIDISPGAIEVAKLNAAKNGVSDRIEFILSDLLDECPEKNFDILVSNPPYIADDEPLHVGLSYEPNLALYGGKVGGEILEKIFHVAIDRKVTYLACEMGYDQREQICRLASHYTPKFYKDLASLDRGFVIKLSNK